MNVSEASTAPAMHRTLFMDRPVPVAAVIVTLIASGLWLDARFGWPGQYTVIAATVAVYGWLYWRSSSVERRVLTLCAVIAGTGEVILSLIWGLYDYQFHNVPLFVPLGHALLMTLGLIVTRHIPERLAPWWVGAVVAAAILWGGYAWVADLDRFGVVLCGVFLLCAAFGKARALYATMFVLALTMELYGTALGNWRWADIAPGLGLTQFNPPYSAGAFYALLDLLVLNALRLWRDAPGSGLAA
jgi:hypothetical protein